MNDFNANAYEQIALAVAYGQDAANDVVLSSYEAEPVVRLAIKKYAGAADARVLAFDITPDANGAYHNGAYQWSGLTNSELEAITTFCNSIDWTFTYDAAAGTYEIARPAFALISNLDFANGIATAPSATYSKDDSTFPLKVAKAMREGYIDYTTLSMRTDALSTTTSATRRPCREWPRETERARPPSTSPLLSGS